MSVFDRARINQIVYALERQEAVLEAQAVRLLQAHDYSAEFLASDAARLREAVDILQALPITTNRPQGDSDARN